MFFNEEYDTHIKEYCRNSICLEAVFARIWFFFSFSPDRVSKHFIYVLKHFAKFEKNSIITSIYISRFFPTSCEIAVVQKGNFVRNGNFDRIKNFVRIGNFVQNLGGYQNRKMELRTIFPDTFVPWYYGDPPPRPFKLLKMLLRIIKQDLMNLFSHIFRVFDHTFYPYYPLFKKISHFIYFFLHWNWYFNESDEKNVIFDLGKALL